MTKYSTLKDKEKNYSIPTTSTPNHHAQRIPSTPASLLNLQPTTKLPPVVKEYMCFQNDCTTSQTAKCIKSRKMNSLIDSVLSIDTFEHQCVVLKGML